jgi:hypothetical protein
MSPMSGSTTTRYFDIRYDLIVVRCILQMPSFRAHDAVFGKSVDIFPAKGGSGVFLLRLDDLVRSLFANTARTYL